MGLGKRLTAAGVLAAVMFGLFGCQLSGPRSDAGAYEKIQKRLIELTSYKSSGTVTYISNKNSHTYDVNQYVKASGEYRIEVTGPAKVAGNTTVCDGRTIAQYNERVQGKIILGTKDAPERYEILLTNFVKNYVKSQEASVSAANMDAGVCTVLEASIPGENPYMSSEKLWVDNVTQTPVKLVIYDPSGGERVVVTFAAFEYNAELDPSLFVVK
jgi:outer membrane lipoprotein-sorting protein